MASANLLLAQKTYKVGDYFNEDGMEGVVFEVSADGRKGKIISLNQSNYDLVWSTVAEHTGATSKTDGRVNMQKIMKLNNWKEKYPAFAWCANLGNEWYIPATEELKSLLSDNSYALVENTMCKVGTPLNTTEGIGNNNTVLIAITSSTEISQSQTEYVSIWNTDKKGLPNKMNWEITEKNSTHCLRAVARFDNSVNLFNPTYVGDNPSESSYTYKDLGNGNYIEMWTFDDGTTKTVTCSDCPYCFGLGLCSLCHGAGQTYVPAGIYSTYVPCTACQSTGHCRFCGGEGKLKQVVVGNSNTGAWVGSTNGGVVNSGIVDTSGNSDYSSGSSGSSSSSNDRYGHYDCPTCYGSGTCQTCNGKGWYSSPYTSGTINCPNCYSGHKGKCSACQGTGKKYGVK